MGYQRNDESNQVMENNQGDDNEQMVRTMFHYTKLDQGDGIHCRLSTVQGDSRNGRQQANKQVAGGLESTLLLRLK